MTKQQNNLNWEQIKAIFDYKNHYGFVINRKLRGEEEMLSYDKSKMVEIDEALKNIPYYKGDLIRCVDLRDKPDVFERFMKQHKEGAVIEYTAYTSFSTDFRELFTPEANIRLTVFSKKGRDIRDIGFNKEFEVLYERNSKFKVLSNREWKGVHWIELEEI